VANAWVGHHRPANSAFDLPIMRSIALTGNVAAGKTRVAELFRQWGATMIDADQLVREVQAPGTPEFAAIVARFGPGAVDLDGTLDRAALRSLVFADPAARQALEAIVHPAVARRRAALLEAARARGDPVVVSEIPLLFETMDPARFDAVVLVDAPESVRHDRLVRERGLDSQEARRVMAAQWPAERKRAWRDPAGRGALVIENDGDLATLERRARAVWDALARTEPGSRTGG
jgi:dephospho-CoA kinase